MTTPDLSAAPWSCGADLAVIANSKHWSYADWQACIDARASLLSQHGLRPGQVVICPDHSALDLLLMQHALARLGAILLPVRATLGGAAQEQCARQCGAEWSWCSTRAELRPSGLRRDQSAPTDPDLALFIQTSGSSAQPRIVMLRARTLLASAQASNTHLTLGSGDRYLGCLRLSHVGGAAIAYRCALAGATYVLHQAFDTRAVSHALHHERITHVSLVPPMLARLLDHDPTPPPALRVALLGGQALSPALAQRALEARWPLHLTYGMSETGSQIATSARLQDLPEPGHIGQPLPGIELDAAVCGEPAARLRLRGTLVMAGYANASRTPGEGLEHGWFESADLACRDAQGNLRVLGRSDDIRVIGGHNISLANVEAQLSSAPGVSDIVVVALDEPVWGWRLMALYCGESDPDTVQGWARGRLSGASCPREFRRLEQLPLLHSGKYDRQRLQALAQQP